MTNNRAALYCRLSKEDAEKQGESESIQNQKALLIDYARERGWDIWNIYSDEDYSGADRERPAFNRLLQDAMEGRFDIVVVKTQSRFTRDMELVEKYIHGLFPLWGIRFVAVVDNADTSVRGNKKARQINGLINEWYLEDLSENIRAVFDIKRRGGQYIGSFPAYGYRKDPSDHNHLLIDEPAAEIVRSIYHMCLAGMGRQRIAALLNAQGIPNPTAYKQQQGLRYVNGAQRDFHGGWNRTSVGRILKNPLYTGDLVQGVRRKASYKSKRLLAVPPADWIVVPNTHAPIVDRETFDTVKRLLEERTRSDGSGLVHPLAGLVRCMDCGSAMLKYSNTYQGKRRSYLRCKLCNTGRCTAHAIRLDLVENRMCALLKAHAQGIKLSVTEKDNRDAAPLKRELARLHSEIQRRDKASRSLYLDKADGLLSAEQFQEMNQAYQSEKKTLEKRAALLEEQLASWEQPQKLEVPLDWDSLPRALAVLTVKLVEIGERNPETGCQPIRITWNF